MRNPLEPRVHELKVEVTRLEKQLHKAHTIMDVQGNGPRPTRPSWRERNSGAGVDYGRPEGSDRQLIGGLPRRETWSRDSSEPEYGALFVGARLGN